MPTNNLLNIKFILYLLTGLSGIIQLILSKTIVDFSSVALIVALNLFVIIYCFNDKYFFNYPLSLNIIFFSYFFSYGGALYLNTLEFRHINTRLNVPGELLIYLSYFWLVIIFSHLIYRKMKSLGTIKNKLNNFFFKINIMSVKDYNFLIFLTFTGYAVALIAFFYSKRIQDHSIYFDILQGFRIFYLTPILIIFSEKLYNIGKNKNKFFLLTICFIIIVVVAISSNSRGKFYSIIFLYFIILFISYQIYETRRIRLSFNKILMALLIAIVSFSVLEILSVNFLQSRGERHIQNRFERIEHYMANFNLKKIVQFKKERIDSQKHQILSEFMYENTIYNRLNLIYIHDQNYLMVKDFNDEHREVLRELTIGKTIAIFPKPLINIFIADFDKLKYIKVSLGSYVRNLYGKEYVLSRALGSLPVLYKLIFGNYFPIFLFFSSIVIFVLGDSFYDNKKFLISPIFIICAFSAGGGFLGILSAADIVEPIRLLFRQLPQTVILYVILLSIFNLYSKKN